MCQFAGLLLAEQSPLLGVSIRRILWNLPPMYAIGGMVLLIINAGLWAASRW